MRASLTLGLIGTATLTVAMYIYIDSRSSPRVTQVWQTETAHQESRIRHQDQQPQRTLSNTQREADDGRDARIHQEKYNETLLVALQTYSASESDRAALFQTLVGSGAAEDPVSSAAARFRSALAVETTVVEWGCYQAGCFFRTQGKNSDTLLDTLVRARSSAAELNEITAVLDDGPNQKLIVVVTGKG